MYRFKTTAVQSSDEVKVVFSAVMQQLVDTVWTDPVEGEEITAELTWYLAGKPASAIPANTTQANSAVRALSGQRVYLMPDLITITDASDLDQIQTAPAVIAGVINSSGGALETARSYQDAASTTIDVSGSTGRIDIYPLLRTLRTVLKSEFSGNILLINGQAMAVHGWIRDGRTVGEIDEIQYTGGKMRMKMDPAGVQSSQLVMSAVAELHEVPLTLGTREILVGTGFPFQVLNSNGVMVSAHEVVTPESCRIDVTALSTKIYLVVPVWVSSLWTYLGGASLVADPELTPDDVDNLTAPMYTPAGTTVLGKIYRYTSSAWILADATVRANQIAKLWMARGASVGVSGMIAEGMVTNPSWSFTTAQFGQPIYLSGAGLFVTTRPTETLAPSTVPRVVGYICSAHTIYFSGALSVLVSPAVVFDPGAYEAGLETVQSKIYRRLSAGWQVGDVSNASFASARLFMALGTDPEVNGMISEGIVYDAAWDFAAEDKDKPVYLDGDDGSITIVVPTYATAPGDVARHVGFVNDANSIRFDGNILGGVLKA